MNISDYLFSEGLILIPVLIIVGKIIKQIKVIDNKFIPLILLALGVACALAMMGPSVSSAIQGVLIAGTAVFGNQLVKQLSPINE